VKSLEQRHILEIDEDGKILWKNSPKNSR
jgi:hypothetical protein